MGKKTKIRKRKCSSCWYNKKEKDGLIYCDYIEQWIYPSKDCTFERKDSLARRDIIGYIRAFADSNRKRY